MHGPARVRVPDPETLTLSCGEASSSDDATGRCSQRPPGADAGSVLRKMLRGRGLNEDVRCDAMRSKQRANFVNFLCMSCCPCNTRVFNVHNFHGCENLNCLIYFSS